MCLSGAIKAQSLDHQRAAPLCVYLCAQMLTALVIVVGAVRTASPEARVVGTGESVRLMTGIMPFLLWFVSRVKGSATWKSCCYGPRRQQLPQPRPDTRVAHIVSHAGITAWQLYFWRFYMKLQHRAPHVVHVLGLDSCIEPLFQTVRQTTSTLQCSISTLSTSSAPTLFAVVVYIPKKRQQADAEAPRLCAAY